MNTKSSKRIAAGFAALMIAPAFAVEAPADDAPPPPVAPAPPATASAPAAPARLPEFKLPAPAAKNAAESPAKTAFLGIVSSPVSDCLADHIGLKPGEGVIVRSMVKDGPAAKAGIEVNDVIVAVGGQPIDSASDISKRMSAHKPGESVSLDIVHKGERKQVSVDLCCRPEGYAAAEPMSPDQMHLENLPAEIRERIKAELAGKVGGIDLSNRSAASMLAPGMEEAMKELQGLMEKAAAGEPFNLPDNFAAGARHQSSATFRMQDNDGSIEVKSVNGSKEVTLRDRQDQVVWNGPWNTDQDRSAAPANVRDRMQGVGLDNDFQGGGLRFQPKPAPDSADNGR